MSEFAKYTPAGPGRDPFRANDGLVVRAAEEGDLEAVARVAADREDGDVARWRGIFAEFYRRCRGSRTGRLYVARIDDRIVGYGKAEYFEPPEDAPAGAVPAGWYLSGLVARPRWRRRGVGTRLTRPRLEWIAKRAREAYYFANSLNRVSIVLHDRFGFREIRRGCWHPAVRFQGGVGILYRCALGGEE